MNLKLLMGTKDFNFSFYGLTPVINKLSKLNQLGAIFSFKMKEEKSGSYKRIHFSEYTRCSMLFMVAIMIDCLEHVISMTSVHTRVQENEHQTK